ASAPVRPAPQGEEFVRNTDATGIPFEMRGPGNCTEERREFRTSRRWAHERRVRVTTLDSPSINPSFPSKSPRPTAGTPLYPAYPFLFMRSLLPRSLPFSAAGFV